MARGILVGDPARIEAAAGAAGYELGPDNVVTAPDESGAIREAIKLVKEGRADSIMKGKVTTANLIRGVLDREAGLRAGRLLSQVIAFEVPGISRLMLMTDAAVNIAPTLAEKADICRNAIEVAHALGIEHPNVALLTALEFVNPMMPATVDAAALAQMNRRGQISGAYLEGPIALDAPLSRFAAERKSIDSPVVEATDIFIPPDIEAANILFRAIIYFAHGSCGRTYRRRARPADRALPRRAGQARRSTRSPCRGRPGSPPGRRGFGMRVLVPNLGSTSLKYQLLDMADETVVAHGRIELIGSDRTRFSFSAADGSVIEEAGAVPDHRVAVDRLLEHRSALERGPDDAVDAVGLQDRARRPRVYGQLPRHGQVLEAMKDFSAVAPIHNPIYIQAIEILRDALPGTPMVAVFEPGFHRTIPESAFLYGVPYEWSEKYGVRRYGFHGSSHRYVSQRVAEILGARARGLRNGSCHLGGSSSLCAVRDGESVDTSFGFSPQSGLEQGTRCGDLDPFAVFYLMERTKATVGEMAERLCKSSGPLGISGVSGDLREIEEAAERGHRRAALAIDVFVHGIKKQIGASAAVMGGLDALAFTGGIGENSWRIRERVCLGLEFLGVELDPLRNRDPDSYGGVVSAPDAPAAVVVVRTDEELAVAREAVRVLRGDQGALTRTVTKEGSA